MGSVWWTAGSILCRTADRNLYCWPPAARTVGRRDVQPTHPRNAEVDDLALYDARWGPWHRALSKRPNSATYLGNRMMSRQTQPCWLLLLRQRKGN